MLPFLSSYMESMQAYHLAPHICMASLNVEPHCMAWLNGGPALPCPALCFLAHEHQACLPACLPASHLALRPLTSSLMALAALPPLSIKTFLI